MWALGATVQSGQDCDGLPGVWQPRRHKWGRTEQLWGSKDPAWRNKKVIMHVLTWDGCLCMKSCYNRLLRWKSFTDYSKLFLREILWMPSKGQLDRCERYNPEASRSCWGGFREPCSKIRKCLVIVVSWLQGWPVAQLVQTEKSWQLLDDCHEMWFWVFTLPTGRTVITLVIP